MDVAEEPWACRLRLGTSSWSEKAWQGVFYPAGLRPGDQLGYYATRFDTVEADVTYYRVPDLRLARGWATRTPDGLTLAAKFPRSIVHCGEGAAPDAAKVLVREAVQADVERFLEAMELLGARCGPLVLQFPYFNRACFADAAPFLERLEAFLDGLPPRFRYGVELRNKAWIGPELLALLRRRRVALVLVDIAHMPHPADLWSAQDLVTADFVYARLIGDRKRIDGLTGELNRTVLDQSARLERWARPTSTRTTTTPATRPTRCASSPSASPAARSPERERVPAVPRPSPRARGAARASTRPGAGDPPRGRLVPG